MTTKPRQHCTGKTIATVTSCAMLQCKNKTNSLFIFYIGNLQIVRPTTLQFAKVSLCLENTVWSGIKLRCQMLFIVNLHCITREKKRQRKLELIKFDKELSNPVLFKHQSSSSKRFLLNTSYTHLIWSLYACSN